MIDFGVRMTEEMKLAKSLGRVFGRHQAELARYMGDPPDVRNVPDSFWNQVQAESEEAVREALVVLYLLILGDMGAESTADQVRALSWSKQRASRTTAEMTTTSKGMTTADATQSAMDRATVILGPERAERIAATEATVTITAATEDTATAYGLTDSLDTWIAKNDSRVCELCQPMGGKPRRFWERYFPEGPPVHPRCRCWIQLRNTIPIGANENEPETAGI